MMMYIKIDLYFIFPLVNYHKISIVDIQLMAGPLCIAHLVLCYFFRFPKVPCVPPFWLHEEATLEGFFFFSV